MDKETINRFIGEYGNYFLPSKDVNEEDIYSVLEKANDDFFRKVDKQIFISPGKMILISFLVGWLGVDRFILGEKHILLKLITLGGSGIWYWIDIIRAKKRVRDYNLKVLVLAVQDYDGFMEARKQSKALLLAQSKQLLQATKELRDSFDASPY